VTAYRVLKDGAPAATPHPTQETMTVNDPLDRLLRPRAIAVVGASPRPGSLSGRFVAGLQRHGYAGRIVPVNPGHQEVLGLPCVPTIQDAGEIDLAVISLAATRVLESADQCAEAGVGGALVFSSGFGEVSEEGHAEQRKLGELAARSGMRIVGPNSPGFINIADRTCVSALGVAFRPTLRSGSIAVLAQSGGGGGLLVERAVDAGMGVSLLLCTGNEADLTISDVLPWLAADRVTKVVALFMEAIRRPDEFVAGLDQLRAAGKHVVILKGGSTEAGARATAAHTGALASDDDVVGAMLERHQVPRVHSFEDLLATAMTLERLGPATGRRVGILTTSGGAGVVAAESAERAGLELPGPAPATRERLAAAAPDFAAISNPADMSGMFSEREEIFTESLAALSAAEEFDQLMLVLTVHPPDISQRLAELVLRGVQATSTPLAILWMAGGMSAPSIAWLREQGLAVYDDAERCGRALAARAFLGRSADAAESPELPPLPAPGPFTDTLLESEAMELLAGADVPVPVTLLTTDPESAATAAESIAGPVAVKAAARDLLHRSDAGAVVLGVSSGAEAAAAHTRVVEAARAVGATPEGSVVQQMSPAGVELIVGARRDPEFGPVLVVGMGGVTAELQADVSRRLLPLREGEALAMLQELRTFALLAGYRGTPAGDVAGAARAIDGIARLAVALGDRLEAIEVNPLIVGPDGAVAVDALFIPAATPSPPV
jgi:acyl-CoA synthetase (NDP forming)